MKLLKTAVIPFLILLLSVFLLFSEYKRQNISLFTTVKQYSSDYLSGALDQELLAGQKVSGQFTATSNNLGIIAVRFNTFWRINDDWIIFRIRPATSPNWYYENQYKVDQFQNRDLFTFGFPEISNSAGNTYYFELESLQGQVSNAVAVDSKYPSFQARYRFPREDLLSIKSFNLSNIGQLGISYVESFSHYLHQKLSVSFSDLPTSIITLIYFTPAIIYLLIYHREKKYILSMLVIMTFLDIFVIDRVDDLVTTIIFLGWSGYIILSKPKTFYLAVSGLFLLLISATFYYLPNLETISDKSGAWALLTFVLSLATLNFKIHD